MSDLSIHLVGNISWISVGFVNVAVSISTQLPNNSYPRNRTGTTSLKASKFTDLFARSCGDAESPTSPRASHQAPHSGLRAITDS